MQIVNEHLLMAITQLHVFLFVLLRLFALAQRSLWCLTDGRFALAGVCMH